MTSPDTRAVPDRHGFTLIEMLFVVMVVSVLATLVLPNYRKSQLKAQAADVLGRVNAINIAVKSYEADNQTLAPFSGPVGQAPAFLLPYVTSNLFAGPADITFQLTRTDVASPPELVITANGEAEAQILLAAAAQYGSPRAVIVGGGASIIVIMAD